MALRLTKNAIKCASCLDEIESKYTHDFKRCKCGAVFVDGGLDYVRRGGDLDKIINLSVYEESDEKC